MNAMGVCAACREMVLRQREKWEAKHMGDFTRIYPNQDPEKQARFDEIMAGAREVINSRYASKYVPSDIAAKNAAQQMWGKSAAKVQAVNKVANGGAAAATTSAAAGPSKAQQPVVPPLPVPYEPSPRLYPSELKSKADEGGPTPSPPFTPHLGLGSDQVLGEYSDSNPGTNRVMAPPSRSMMNSPRQLGPYSPRMHSATVLSLPSGITGTPSSVFGEISGVSGAGCVNNSPPRRVSTAGGLYSPRRAQLNARDQKVWFVTPIADSRPAPSSPLKASIQH